MMMTRSRKAKIASAKRSYRRRVKASKCRKVKRARTCKRKSGCKYISTKKRRYCRKSKNTKRHPVGYGGRRGGMTSGLVNEAALPFGLLALQKYYQNKKHKK